MNKDYFAVPISENLARTPEGYLICLGCVIARTGPQDYLVKDISADSLVELGLNERYTDPDEVIQVFRSEEEVFAPATIASFEGKAVTDAHPEEFVDIDNHSELDRGHVMNVRRGDEPLSDGNIPLLADLIITDSGLADDILAKRKRELSCGYGYVLAYENGQLSQTNITGNHVAVVDRARAGHEARINDAATTPTRKPRMKIKEWLFGPGIVAMAKDNVEPEQIAAMARAFDADEKSEEKEEKKAEDADPMAEIKDSLKGICDRLDKLEASDRSEDADEDKEEGSESEDSDEDEDDDEGEEEKSEDRAKDSFVDHDNAVLLKVLKPLIAKSPDAELKKAFNSLISKANDSKRGGTPKDSYAAAKSASQKSNASDSQENIIDRLNKRAQAAFRGEKEVK